MDKVEECISFLLGKAQQRVTRRAKELLAEHDVTPVQYAALCVLWEKEAQTAAELGARLAIDSATMTGVIDRLERSGLIRRHADESDRRIYQLYLTDRGRALRSPLDSAMEKLNAEVAELLGKDWPRFHRMLRKVGTSS
ncbi:MarR family transcriptional regulator [Bradyrhizobium sp. BRP22]|uniref:MarR family winged helix-turn-helix transcriptional regulator n=1 Tax=Bradyrhizobium sp. BRP22 TaxID=2793821 RepID=UPI001CD6FD8E|nr:MarR family transcriptional regulator [Bradyrhizobium sp. BRP22]MCA1453909.1 MarR family transcriptional regulator [Bradyrhizobium sp. BRP22]